MPQPGCTASCCQGENWPAYDALVAIANEEMRLATMKTTENGTKQFIVWHGTRAVSCYRDDVLDIWKARLYVNCRNEQLGDATLTTRDHLTRKQATEWAKATVAKKLKKQAKKAKHG